MSTTGEKTRLKEGEVLASIGAAGFATSIRSGAHTIDSGEPEDSGGKDEGPSPYDLLLASLGACKAMTMRMYADRKGWALGRADVRLRHSRIHAKDCESCEHTDSGKVDRIDVDITLFGDLDDEQRRRLLEIAGKCPVHRTLTSETEIIEKLGEAS